MDSTATLQAIKDLVHTYPPEVEAWLFGSRARGDARPDSDWDVLLIYNSDADTVPQEDRFKYSFTLNMLGVDIGATINTVNMTSRHWAESRSQTLFYHNVIQDRIRL